jgi:FKBP-type peptidyl-prolyl cis-trans isomerase 2
VKIEKGRRVTVKVDLSIVGGDPLEKNTVEYVQGGGTMLPGLEAVLEGLEKGAKKEGVIKAKDAFGNAKMHPTKTMKRSEFPKDLKLKEGERFTAKGVNGGMDVVLQLEKIKGDDIKFSAEVIQVRDPRAAPPPLPAAALELEEE